MTKYLLLAIAVLTISLLAMAKLWSIAIKDRNRLFSNQTTLLSEVRSFKLADSSNAAMVGSLTLKLSEIKRSSDSRLDEMRSTLKLMDIKLRKLQNYSSANTETVTNVNTYLHDSLIFDTIPIKHLLHKTKWNEVELTLFPSQRDSISMKVITYDQMEQVVWKGPRGWKFWKKTFWRKRPLNQTIRFQNPNTKISYPVHIIVK